MGSNSQHNPDRRGELHPPQRADVGHNRELIRDLSGNAHKRVLVRALTHDIIPRLVSALPPSLRPPGATRPAPVVDGQEVLEFAHLVLQVDEAPLQERMQALQARGIPHHRLLTALLMPVANHLGRLWEHDLCDFQDVTLATGRLQHLVRHSAPPVCASLLEGRPARRILLSTCRSEQHTLGLSMVAEFFVREGWDVVIGYLGTEVSPVQLVREQWFDMVGLSLGSTSMDTEFARLIEALRKASLNQDLPIIAGGPMFLLHPAEYAQRFKVDAIITDASQAPARAEQLLLRQGRPQPYETAQ